ncbi:MAG: hypothetical protein R2883_08795 [Caldisericia bacterium]
MGAYERELRRQQRLYEEEMKRLQKEEELNEALSETDEYEQIVKVLTLAHQGYGRTNEKIDWRQELESSLPDKPDINREKSESFQTLLDNFKPTFLQKLFKADVRFREYYRNNIAIAKKSEEEEYQNNLKIYEHNLREFEKKVNYAKRILDGDKEAFKDVVKAYLITSKLQFSNSVECIDDDLDKLNSPGIDIVPTDEKIRLVNLASLFQKIPATKKMQMYRDFISSNTFLLQNKYFYCYPWKKSLWIFLKT